MPSRTLRPFPVPLLFVLAAHAATAQSFTGLCDLRGGAYTSGAYAVSANGFVIVGESQNPSKNTAAWVARLACSTSSTYCRAGTTSSSCQALLSASGAASASTPAGYVVTANHVEGQKQGLFFYGRNGAAALPWGSGSSYLCVNSPTQRTASSLSGGTNGSCDGELALDWNAFVTSNPGALGAPVSGGEQLWIQAWFRDPPAPKTTSLSNALTTIVCP